MMKFAYLQLIRSSKLSIVSICCVIVSFMHLCNLCMAFSPLRASANFFFSNYDREWLINWFSFSHDAPFASANSTIDAN